MAINERAAVEVRVNGEQAKQELKNLESYANSLKGRLAEAYNAGDTKQISELDKQLKEANAELRKMRTNAKNIDEAMNNIGLATPKELRVLLSDINKKLNSGHVKRGSAEWKKYQEQLKLVKAEIRKVNNEAKETQGWLTRFNNGFARWGGLLASAAAGITGVSMALSTLRKNRDEKESSAANLKALTGLDDESIQWLKRQAEILSTTLHNTGLRVTQSSKDILEAYMLVGSAKPDLLADKEALNAVTIEAMRLSKAAKMDLKEAVDAVTLSMNQYGASADEAARYTNVMAAGSKFGSAAVQSITAAVIKAGVSASGANVSIEELVGSIEMLAEKGVKDEVAGTGLKMFFLRLQTGAKETNPAVVGLQTALKNLQKLSVNEVVKRFGAETYTVAKILIDSAEKVDYYTKAVTGTNVAMEQAAINSDTNEAKMAQYKNQIKEAGIQLMEKLNPSLSALTGWTTKIIKAAPAMIDWMKEYGRVISYATTILITYIAAKKLQWFWLNKVKTETGQYIVMQKLKIYWTKAITATNWLYVAASSALTGEIKLAAKAMKIFFGILKLNPFAAALTAVAAVAGAIYLLSTRTTEAGKAIKQYLTETTKERNELRKLTDAASKAGDGTKRRKELIEEINTKYGKYLDNLLDEKSSLNDIKKAYREINTAMEQNIAKKVLDEKTEEISRDMLDKKVSKMNSVRKTLQADLPITQVNEISKKVEEATKNILEAGQTTESAAQAIYNSIRKKYYLNGYLNPDMKDKLKDYADVVIKEMNRIKDVQNELAAFAPGVGNSNELQEVVITAKNLKKETNGSDGLTDKQKQEKLKNDLKAVEAASAKEEAIIKEKYARGEMTYRVYCKAINENDIKELDNKMALYDKESNEYNQLLSKKQDLLMKGLEQESKFTIDEIEARAKKEEMFLVSSYYDQKISKKALNEGLFQLEVDTLKKKQSLYTKDSKEWQDYEKQLIDTENREKLRKQEVYQQLLSSVRDSYSKKDLDQLMQEEIDGIDYLHKNGLIKEDEYQKLLKAIQKKYLKEKIDQVDNPAPDDEPTASFLGGDFQKLKDKYALINDAEKQGNITHQEALQQKAEADANYLEELKAKTEAVYSSLSAIVTAYSNYTNACQDLEVTKIEKKYDDQIKAAGDNTTKTKQLEEKKEKEVAKVKSKYNKKAMQIEIAQAFASMAMSAINAYSSAAQVPMIGYILGPIAAAAAVAAGMMNIATIKKQHQAQEAGYYSGGFTDRGDYRKEVGVVHAGEFVANHKAVNNPNVLPVLRLIDNAQKNNTIGSLTATDISRTIHTRLSVPSGNDPESSNVESKIEPLINMLGYSYTVIDKLKNRLDEPFVTVNTVDGDHGIKRALDQYDKTLKIKSR